MNELIYYKILYQSYVSQISDNISLNIWPKIITKYLAVHVIDNTLTYRLIWTLDITIQLVNINHFKLTNKSDSTLGIILRNILI